MHLNMIYFLTLGVELSVTRRIIRSISKELPKQIISFESGKGLYIVSNWESTIDLLHSM